MAVTSEELKRIRKEGLKVLIDKLGVDGMIKFIQAYGDGKGDYTEERRKILESIDKKELEEFLKENANK